MATALACSRTGTASAGDCSRSSARAAPPSAIDSSPSTSPTRRAGDRQVLRRMQRRRCRWRRADPQHQATSQKGSRVEAPPHSGPMSNTRSCHGGCRQSRLESLPPPRRGPPRTLQFAPRPTSIPSATSATGIAGSITERVLCESTLRPSGPSAAPTIISSMPSDRRRTISPAPLPPACRRARTPRERPRPSTRARRRAVTVAGEGARALPASVITSPTRRPARSAIDPVSTAVTAAPVPGTFRSVNPTVNPS